MKLELIKEEIKKVIPRFLIELSEHYPFYIAGGSIRSIILNEKINDLDIYLKRGCDIIGFFNFITANCRILSVTKKSIFMVHGKQHLNIVLLDLYNDATDIFESFDFTCVMGAYDVNNDNLILHEDFLLSNAQREIRYNPNTKYPISSLFRVKKYIDKGYNINKLEIVKIILHTIDRGVLSLDDLKEQIGGMYGYDIDTLGLDGDGEFNLSYIINNIDKIKFNKKSDNNRIKKSFIEYSYEMIYDLLFRSGYKFKKVPIKIFDKYGVNKSIELITINGVLHWVTDKYEDIEMEEEVNDIIIYKNVKKDNNGNYTIMSRKIDIGEVINFDNNIVNEFKGIKIKTYDNFNKLNYNLIGKFRIRANWVVNFDEFEGSVRVFKLELLEIIENKKIEVRKKMHDLPF